MDRELFSITEAVKGAATIGISGHEKPDGDCVGSCLGLALFLRNALPDVRIDVFLEQPPKELTENVPGADTINTAFATDVGTYDVFIVCDSSKGRINGAERLFDAAKKKINIAGSKVLPKPRIAPVVVSLITMIM